MRWGIAAIAALGVGIGLVSSASAADWGPLRGSTYDPPRARGWAGVYVGGHVGTGGGGATFDGEVGALIERMVAHTNLEGQGVQDWVTAGRADTGQAVQYGGFIGYNFQWDDVVFGLEASYHRTDLTASAGGRTPVGGSYILIPYDTLPYAIPTAVSGESYISLSDFGTLRGRVGWDAGSFLPYVAAGVAIGRASYGSTASLYRNRAHYTGDPPELTVNPWPNNVVTTASDTKSNALIYGWSAGLGMDVALTDNIFLRGEYEFIQFSQMRLNLNNVRVGAGIKF